jgi:amino acid adenylation domain-containing protein
MNTPMHATPRSTYEAGERRPAWRGPDPDAPPAASHEVHAGERGPAILPEAERQRLLLEWNDTAFAYPDDGCIHEVFAAQAARAPGAMALSFEGQELSYGALNERANRLAHALRRHGVGPEVVVGVLMERSLEMVVALLGVLKAGGAYVPLDPEYPESRLGFMLADTAAQVILTQARLAGSLPAHGATVIRVDADWGHIAAELASDPPSCGLTLDSLAYVIYTSGSTGRPKGAMNAHRGIKNRLAWMQRAHGLTAADRVLQKTPFSFDVSVWELFWPLMFGARLVIARPGGHRDPGYLADVIAERGITTLHFVPSMLVAFLDEPRVDRCRGLTRVFASGEALPPALMERVFARLGDVELHNLYGPTEAAVDVTAWTCRRGAAVVPIGRPIDNVRIYILDERMEPVPTGTPGELYIGGVQVGRGYLNRPELTAERFVKDPFAGDPGARLYRTGDVARWMRSGDVEYLGRADFQVKIRGFRVELGEIEAVLLEHAGVREAVVVGQEDASGDKRLVAYVTTRGGAAPAPGELRSHLQSKLPEHMVPAVFVTLPELPLTPSGKVDRRALPEPEARVAAGEVEAARTPIEEVLAGMWAQVLKLERVGPGDDFFELGGHSLLATQAVARIRAVLGVDMSVRALFEAPTPAAMARRVDGALRVVPPIVRVPRQGPVALSFGQERLCFLDQLTPGDTSYVVPLVLRFSGRADRAALERAVREIVRRHEALRTTYALLDGRPAGIVHEDIDASLAVTRLTELPEAERPSVARREVAAEVRRPFDLAAGPLLRARLLELDDDEHALLLTMHHIVSDGWTLGILTAEVRALYEAFREGEPSPLAEPAIQYADYAAWQRRWLSGDVLEVQLAYWREQLGGAPHALDVPVDHPRPAVASSRGARRSFVLPAELSGALSKLGQREGATLFMTLLAAFDVLLYRYTGQRDLVVGTPIANRTHAETEGVVGFFVNTLALRMVLSDDESFRALLGRVREVCLGAYTHQEMPFERLVQELSPERDLGRAPLFQVMFVLQNTPREAEAPASCSASKSGGTSTDWLDVEPGTAKFDLTLTMTEGPRGLGGSIEYATDLFEAATVARMAGHLGVLLEGIARAPDAQPWELPMLPDEERRRLLVEWNDTAQSYPADLCVHQMVEAQVDRTPGAVAVIFERERVTYAELDRRANRLASRLRELGVGPDALVGLCVDRSVDMVVGVLGILKAGGAYVPLDPTYPQERLAFMAADAGLAVLVTQGDLATLLPESRAEVVRLDGTSGDGLDARRSGGAGPGSLAYMIYTSGSTGKPKGVQIPHRAVVNLLSTMKEEPGITSEDRLLAVTSLSFDIAALELFLPLTVGATVEVASREVAVDGARLRRLLDGSRITMMQATPSTWRMLLDAGWEGCLGLKALVGGEAVPRDLANDLGARAGAVFNMYGPTETTVWSCVDRIAAGEGPVLIGRPVANTQAYVLDGRLGLAPIGVPGELYLGGAGVARGYLARPELSAERFVADPLGAPGARLYRTGDLCRLRPDGRIEFLGRLDHQVKIRGFRIELGEIEAVLSRHPALREVVVVAREDTPGDKRLVAYVTTRGGAAPAPGVLRSHLQRKLPEHMVPAVFVALDRLPRLANGKLDRRALPAPSVEAATGAPRVAPRDATELKLRSIWEDVPGGIEAAVLLRPRRRRTRHLLSSDGEAPRARPAFLWPAALVARPPHPRPVQRGPREPRDALPRGDPAAPAHGPVLPRRRVLRGRHRARDRAAAPRPGGAGCAPRHVRHLRARLPRAAAVAFEAAPDRARGAVSEARAPRRERDHARSGGARRVPEGEVEQGGGGDPRDARRVEASPRRRGLHQVPRAVPRVVASWPRRGAPRDGRGGPALPAPRVPRQDHAFPRAPAGAGGRS